MILEGRWHGFENCCFLTLTYDDSELEKRGEVLKLDKVHIQKWLKRFRKELFKYEGIRIRYYLCGEYGEKGLRPHYHIVAFGATVERILLGTVDSCIVRNNRGYSVRLKSWPFGFVYVASFEQRVAFYVAQYLGKSTPARKKELESLGLPPEFCLMSRKPGLGAFEINRRRLYYAKHPVSGWRNIESVKEFARHSRYIESKIYPDDYDYDDSYHVDFERFKREQKIIKENSKKELAIENGLGYRDYILQERGQVEANIISRLK